MKRLNFICMIAACTLLLSSCQDGTPIEMQGIAGDIKETLQQQVVSFFESDDLFDTFGIDKSRQKQIEQSIQNYINNYELDEKALNQAKEAVYEVLEDAKDFSPEELDEKIADIFKKQD